MDAVATPAESVSRLLLDSGLITPEMAARAAGRGERFATALVRSGAVTGDELLRRFTRRRGDRAIDVDGHALQPDLLTLLPEEILQAAGLLPLRRINQILFVAVPTGWRPAAELPELEAALGLQVEPIPVEEADVPGLLLKGLQLLRRRSRDATAESGETRPATEIDGPRGFDPLFDRAAELGAEEIRLERLKDGAEVRFRIDGRLRPSAAIASSPESIARRVAEFKAVGGTQGRFRRGTVEVRVAVHPTPYGETAVLRFVGGSKRDLGLSDGPREAIRRAIDSGRGLILVAGPAGSGRTTTLAAMATDEAVVLDDLRDRERASGALRDAVAGRLVLASIDAADATGAVAAMIELGVDATMLSMGLALSVAQRLVRRICAGCRRPEAADPGELEDLGLDRVLGGPVLYRGVGCAACGGDGHRGRAAIAETWAPDDALRDQIVRKTGPGRLRSLALARGLRPLVADGIERVRSGLTTLAELREAVPFSQLVQARDFAATIP